jgi:Bacterial protein of unknown function (DUF885)
MRPMLTRRHFTFAAAALPLGLRAAASAPWAHDFIESLWRLDPGGAVLAGRFEFVPHLAVPGQTQRQHEAAFWRRWRARLASIRPEALTATQRTDLAMLRAKVEAEAWDLEQFRSWQWDPSRYNVAEVLDLALNTEYAPLPKRLRGLQQRLRLVPAFYRAAQASLLDVTRPHTELALQQAPGVLAVLDDIGKRSPRQMRPELAAARAAVQGYQAFLLQLLPRASRSFRSGEALYEAKFVHDIQASRSAKQTYELALVRREELLAQMDASSRLLWPQQMGDTPMPTDRFARIGAAIDKLSARHVPRARFVEEIRAQIPQLEAWVRDKDLLTLDASKPLRVRETPLYKRGVAGAGIDAPGPYRPQDRTYYNVTPLDGLSDDEAESTLREYNHWILQILNIHEAIPGHYAQLIYANRAPSLVKSLFGNGAMIEGWAVYSERLMIDSGYGASPEMSLMYGKWHLRSVTNTILDYRVHVLDLPENEALDLLTRQAFQTEREAKEKWRRVQLTQVQLTSYFSGYAEIMALREQLMQRPGFQLKAFHERFLSFGSAPVSEIAKAML